MPLFPELRRLLLIAAVLSTVFAEVIGASWRPAPISAERLDRWFQHTDQETLYTRTADLWLRSDDGGRVWQSLPHPPFAGISPTVLHLHPTDPEIVAQQASGGRFAFSRDGGIRWKLVDMPLGVFDGLGFDHRGAFFVADNGELWRSDDFGENWIDVAPASLGRNDPVDLHVGNGVSALFIGGQSPWLVSFDSGQSYREIESGTFDLEVESFAAPTNPRRMVTLSDGGVLGTVDGFATWRALDLPRPAERVQFHPRQARWLFALAPDPVDSSGAVVQVSRDDGSSWNSITLPDGDPFSPLIFDPCDDSVAYARRRAGLGLTRFSLAGDTAALDPPTPELSILDARPRVSRCELLVRTRAGLYAVTDRGEQWTAIGRGLPAPSALEIHFDPANSQRVWAATTGGVATSQDAGLNWSMLPALAGRPISRVLPSRSDGRLLMLDGFGNVLISDDRGASFESTSLFGLAWVADPFTEGAVLFWAPTLYQGWVRLADFGERVVANVEVDGGPSIGLEHVVFDPSTPGRVLGVDFDSRLFVSTDGGLHFTALGEGLGQLVRGFTIDRGGSIFAWDASRLARSVDGGDTFSPIDLVETTEPERLTIRNVVADRHVAGTLYAIGTINRSDDGSFRPVVLRTVDSGATWADWSTGFTSGPISLAQSPAMPNRFLLGGRGIYWLDELLGDACDDSSESLCLRQDRFEVTLEFADGGEERAAKAVPERSGDSGLYTFFDPDNWELMVKVLDACTLNQRFWVLAAATTDRAYSLRILDRATGAERTYHNASGRRSPAIVDTDAFDSCDATPRSAPQRTVSSPQAAVEASGKVAECPARRLCLGEDGRYQVGVRWRDFQGASGDGEPVAIRSNDSGLFTFFDPSNWELMVKVLDACAVNGHVWVLGAATTNVGYDLVVIDTAIGVERTYSNALGDLAPAVIDVEAFGCAG